MPIVIEAAPLLTIILVSIGALIFCYLAIYCAKAFLGAASGTIGKLPIIGGWIDSGIHAVEQKIVSIFSEAANTAQAAMGWSFHIMARQVDWLGREINAHANLLLLLSNVLLGSTITDAIKALLNLLHVRVQALPATTAALFHSLIRPIYGELHALERWTYPKVRAAEHAISVTIPKDIAGLRSRTRTIENSLSKLWDAIRSDEKLLVGTAFAGAVAVALGRLGLGWLRCNSLSNLGNRLGCAGWKIVDDLLAAVIDVLVIADLCQLTKLLIEVAESSEVQGVLSGIIAGIDDLLLCQGVTRPPALDGYTADTPPLQAFSALPAV